MALLTQYGYFLLLPVSILEGPVVAMLAGALVSFHVLNGPLVYAVLVAGDLIGDMFYYWLGHLGRHRIPNTWRSFVGIDDQRIKRLEGSFAKHDWKLLFFGKAHPLGSAILFVSGVVRMPMWKFIFINTLGTLPKVLIFQLVGYYFAESYRSFDGYLSSGPVISVAIIAALLSIYWLMRKEAQKETQQETA